MDPENLNLGQRAADLVQRWAAAYSLITGVGVAPEATSGLTPGVPVSEMSVRVQLGLAAVAKLQGLDAAKLLLLGARAQTVCSSLDALDSVCLSLEHTLTPYQGGSSADRNGSLSLALTHPERGTLNFDLGTPLSTAISQANTLFECLPHISLAAEESSVSTFTSFLVAVQSEATSAQNSAREAFVATAEAQQLLVGVQALKNRADAALASIAELSTAATTQKSTADTNAAEVEQKLARVREISKDADTLQTRVTAFSSQFEAFETVMKSRLEQFSEFEASTKTALAENEKREAEIKTLTERADTMIRGATTAGLSKSLDDARQTYEDRLNRTQLYFIGSVVVLLICSLPIAAQLLPGPWQTWIAPAPNGAANDASPWLSAFGKLVLMLPATWATAFFAGNYAELFHLSREYAHKAALAKAIDGFQREAPDYRQEIVGSVFMEIQDNPRSRRAPPAATPQNPIVKKFLERVLDAIRGRSEEKPS